MKNKANGPTDPLVTEMLQWSPMETVYEVAHWFAKRFKGEVPGLRGLENCPPGISQETRRQARKKAAWVPRDRTAECVLQVVHDGADGSAAQKEGAD